MAGRALSPKGKIGLAVTGATLLAGPIISALKGNKKAEATKTPKATNGGVRADGTGSSKVTFIQPPSTGGNREIANICICRYRKHRNR